MLGVDGRAPDPRVAPHRIDGDGRQTARAISVANADLVIAALGYRPLAPPILDRDGSRSRLRPIPATRWSTRIAASSASTARRFPALYGIGLAAGFVPWGELGGEKSFRGQANGLWLWQNDVGGMIVDQIAGAGEARAVA